MAMTVKNTVYCFSGSHWYMAVRDTSGKARSISAMRKAQLMSSVKRPMWFLK